MKAWEKNVRKIEPYVPGEQPDQSDMIKLNTNENPYPPSPEAEKVLKELSFGSLRLYPDPSVMQLKKAIAGYYQVEETEVFVGVGSDDVLAAAFLTFFNSGLPILFPDITYSFYKVWAELFRIPYHMPKLDENFHIVKEDYFTENGGIIIANPNAPTGIAEEPEFIKEIAEKNSASVVIADEAYVDFGAVSAAKYIHAAENLLVVQTFSKSRSMAGLRIGFALGSKELIQAMEDVKYSYNSYTMNQLSIDLGSAAIKDKEYFRQSLDKIINTRERSKKILTKLGFSCLDSKANFIFASHKQIPAAEIFHALKKKHIYVRYFPIPRIDNYLRITIGTDEQMDRLFDFLREYMMTK